MVARLSLVVVMFLGLNYQHGNMLVINIVDDAVIGCDLPHRLSKYCCISSGVRHEMVSPLAYSLRALLIFRDKAGEIWLSVLTLAVCTEATPRISLKAFLRSATIASGSSVTIICWGCEI